MTGFVDIHAHVLPGIDDGPGDLDGTLALIRAASESGTEVIAATPHLRSDFPDVHVEELADRCDAVRRAIGRDGIPIRLVGGSEASIVWAVEASEEELTLATYEQRGTDLLVETPPGPVLGLDRLLYELRLRGLRVTLAHPERDVDFQHDVSPLKALVDQGVLIQINAGSLLGDSRRSGIRQLAERLCTEGLAHVLASDGHRASSWRPVTTLAQGVEAVTALVGPERAEWMASVTAQAIIDGAELPPAPEIVHRRRSRLFRR